MYRNNSWGKRLVTTKTQEKLSSASVGTTIIYQRKSEENLSFKCAKKKKNDSGNN